MTLLERIVASTREDIARRRERVGLSELQEAIGARPVPRSLVDAVRGPSISVIAEHKRRSPSAGALRAGSRVSDVVGAYERGGAAALSILTEERHFDGSLEDLRAARAASSLPVLRKDFIIDSYQLYESAAAGADAVLLIVAALDAAELGRLRAEARGLALEVLVEVHDAAELERGLALDPDVLGINNRDLHTFSVDVGRTLALLGDVPDGCTVISESGLHRREQLDQLERVGVNGVLVGETLMRASDPEAACRSLTEP